MCTTGGIKEAASARAARAVTLTPHEPKLSQALADSFNTKHKAGLVKVRVGRP